mmetsp:Transcript_40522/g.81703  ORF Transcript_40522/g.81703 Transcript_40522/m.81703 type:complete len:247 (+) Transcript_40522:308-1048(+)
MHSLRSVPCVSKRRAHHPRVRVRETVVAHAPPRLVVEDFEAARDVVAGGEADHAVVAVGTETRVKRRELRPLLRVQVRARLVPLRSKRALPPWLSRPAPRPTLPLRPCRARRPHWPGGALGAFRALCARLAWLARGAVGSRESWLARLSRRAGRATRAGRAFGATLLDQLVQLLLLVLRGLDHTLGVGCDERAKPVHLALHHFRQAALLFQDVLQTRGHELGALCVVPNLLRDNWRRFRARFNLAL